MARVTDDDPTRALDDFVAKLNGRSPDNPVRGGTLRDGTRWSVDDVEDVVEARVVVEPPPKVDVAALEQAVDRSRQAAARDAAEAQRPDQTVALPDAVALGLKSAADPRLLSGWAANAWVAAAHPLMAATSEVQQTPNGPVVETHPALLLIALWGPTPAAHAAPGLWPRRVLIAADGVDAGNRDTLRQVPDEAPLWWLPRRYGGIDWDLIARLAQLHLRGLREAERQALDAVREKHRENAFRWMNDRYQVEESGRAVLRL